MRLMFFIFSLMSLVVTYSHWFNAFNHADRQTVMTAIASLLIYPEALLWLCITVSLWMLSTLAHRLNELSEEVDRLKRGSVVPSNERINLSQDKSGWAIRE